MSPLGIGPREVISLARHAGDVAPKGPILVVGVLAEQLARELAAGGDPALVRTRGNPADAAALVCVLAGAATAADEDALRTATRALVPVVARGLVRRENIIPYVFGANIATLGDTMVAAFALDSPGAVKIVLVEVIATTTVSVLLLTFFYAQTRRGIWAFQRWVVETPARLACFTCGLFLVPIGLIVVFGVAF